MRIFQAFLLFASLFTRIGPAAEMTVSQFLIPPPLGEVVEEGEVAGGVAVQKTPGAHAGHRILSVPLPLCKPSKKGADAARPHALRYHACLEVDKHTGAVEVAPKEGLSGIGMTRPSATNWYAGGFIDVKVNGQSLGPYKPRLRRTVYASGAVAVRSEWHPPSGKVTLTFVQLPDDDFCRVVGEVAAASAGMVDIRLRCFPCITKRTGRRVVWTSSRRCDTAGTLLARRQDTWFLCADVEYDRAKSKRGAGPCAVMFTPSEVASAKASVTNYHVNITLSLRPEARRFHLALWELSNWPNQKALEHLRNLSKGLKADIGRAASVPVRTENVPPRAIVVDRQPAATILLKADASQREFQAADEIQRYVNKSTAAVLPIAADAADALGHVISLRVQDPPQGESREAFRLTVGPRRTEIVGNSPLAVLYGAYELLERGVGCRWYIPNALGEVVPKHSTLVLPAIDTKQSPSFPMRWIGRRDWMLRNKQNKCDDGFLIYPGIYHTQNRILPHSRYFPKRPDFYALVRGKRSEDGQCKLCYSNPDTVREVAKNMASMLDANPNIKLISLSPTDGQMWCECDGCKAMDEKDVPRDRSKSRRSLLFYNAVAAELRKTHPNARMLVGAYNVYNWPPKDESVKADPMIDVIITHYEHYCMAHPVPGPACPLNERYVQLISEWEALGCKVYYYEYYWKVNWLDLPWPIVHSIREDMLWFKKQGHRGVYTQHNPDCIWGQYPAHYIAAKLLWNVEADVDAILDRMYRDLYGAAAPHMNAYHELMEKQMAECGEHFPGRGTSFGPAVFTDTIRAKLREHYAAAVKANKDETVARRLAKIGVCLEYTDRLMRYVALRRATSAEPDPAKALALAKEALKCGDGLLTEIRRDRGKWGGVVSRSVVGTGYLGRAVEKWRGVVARKKIKTIKTVAPLPKTWQFALDKDDVGQKKKWFAPEFDDGAWKPIRIGKTWESQGYDYDGFAWYRVRFKVRKKWLEKPVCIFLGAVDGEAWVYWNGQLLGHHAGWDEPFSFPLDPKTIKTDEPNLVAVRVFDGSNAGGIYKMAYLAEAK